MTTLTTLLAAVSVADLDARYTDATVGNFDFWDSSQAMTGGGEPRWELITPDFHDMLDSDNDDPETMAQAVAYCEDRQIEVDPDYPQGAADEGQDAWREGNDPMMRHTYPVQSVTAEEAYAIGSHLSIAVIEIDGDQVFVLTGCGMDMGWDICAAYVLAGFLPPLRFAADLPRFAGQEDGDGWHAVILRAALRGATIEANHAAIRLERLTERCDKAGIA